MLTPWQILGLLTALVLLVWLGDRVITRSRTNRLRRLAMQRRLQYCPTDRFNIAGRIGSLIPKSQPNANVVEVTVRDLMYRSSDAGYHYVFTAIYVVEGLSGDRRRRTMIASTDEPPGRSCGQFSRLQTADAVGSVYKMYERILGDGAPVPSQQA